MATDYEKFYRQNPHGLGEPTREFVEFFKSYDQTHASVLDVGCGQGRDALFIARLGHCVTAIDLSASGIRDIKKDAVKAELKITTQVIDIRDFKSRSKFDVILIDRTLHMLAGEDRLKTLLNLLTFTKQGSHLLIADQKSNIPDFKQVLEQSTLTWRIKLEKKGFLFACRD